MNPGRNLFLIEYSEERGKRASRIFKKLKKLYPFEYSLEVDNPFELLVATILSAQTTDVNVNKVTPDLFNKYPNPQSLANADVLELEKIIFSTGYYKNKARLLIKMANTLLDKFNGVVPNNMEDLLVLPGVGRKTANVVLQGAFGQPVGIVVDTHVFRISQLLGLAEGKNAEVVEKQLMDLFPNKNWEELTLYLIDHGRAVCIANKPKCHICPLAVDCPSAFYRSQKKA